MKDNDKALDELIRGHYLSQKLSESSVQRILAAGLEEQSQTRRSGGRAWWVYWGPVAAAAAIVMLVAFQLSSTFTRDMDQHQFAAQVAGEIAMRHANGKAFDVQTSSFTGVQNELKELAFSVTPAMKQGLLSAYEVVGARYCYLRGQQAAHLQVRDRVKGTLCTLYIASLNGPLKDLKQTDEHVDLAANEVELWDDGDRLFALVH